MKVSNMTSNNSGHEIANQFIITDDNGNRFFQSYDNTIVKIDNTGKVFLDEKYYDYSRITSKYRNSFLNKTTKEIESNITSGKYTLCNLN